TAWNFIFRFHFLKFFHFHLNAFLHTAAIVFISLCKVLDHRILASFIIDSKRVGEIFDKFIAFPIFKTAVSYTRLPIVIRTVNRGTHRGIMKLRTMLWTFSFISLLITANHRWLIIYMRIIFELFWASEIHLTTALVCTYWCFWRIDRKL